MDRQTITIDSATIKLRRVGRLARRRMRIDGAQLRNGIHTDGTVTVEISGLGSPVAGVPDLFEWTADRPIALVIVRAGIDGEDVTFDVGPAERGVGRASSVGDGSGIRYVAFCYDAPVETLTTRVPFAAPITDDVMVDAGSPLPPPVPLAAAVATRPFAPTHRERRSILSFLLNGLRRSTGGALA